MQKTILHLDLDTFFVSVERRNHPELRERPLLVGGITDRGVVAACSYETRGFGVHSGMPMKMAKELCPEAKVIKGNAGVYSKVSDEITEIIQEAVPVFEKSSIDEFYADLTGMDRFFGSYKYASELRRKIIRQTGMPISFGLSVNKVVSKVATSEAKPNNQLKIDFGLEKSFLAPLSIKKIPMVGDKTYQTLRNLGLRQIQTIQEMPIDVMQRVLGKNGRIIWKRANGIDHTPVIPFCERKSISTERTFDKDTIDVIRLKGILTAMTENLAYQLRRGEKLTACIAVKIRYSDFNTYSKQLRIPYTSADHILIPKILEMFKSLYNRRLLVRLVGIRFSHLVSGNYQINLFDDTEEILNLYHAMDHIRKRYGDKSVIRASGMGARTIGRMHNPFDGRPPIVLAHRKQ
ncbi:MAG: DNA polymerase IV [Pseudozobellia sp.]|nr:DNA polymerase IV [Pseudozobellia sp.]MBG49987.1 DNA polymerase IV [Pseudozobellia sp.]|tara:strand:- start:1202 stop:2416 length:1215 start_codon:yes stop_codon:yes gene_type:complete